MNENLSIYLSIYLFHNNTSFSSITRHLSYPPVGIQRWMFFHLPSRRKSFKQNSNHLSSHLSMPHSTQSILQCRRRVHVFLWLHQQPVPRKWSLCRMHLRSRSRLEGQYTLLLKGWRMYLRLELSCVHLCCKYWTNDWTMCVILSGKTTQTSNYAISLALILLFPTKL